MLNLISNLQDNVNELSELNRERAAIVKDQGKLLEEQLKILNGMMEARGLCLNELKSQLN